MSIREKTIDLKIETIVTMKNYLLLKMKKCDIAESYLNDFENANIALIDRLSELKVQIIASSFSQKIPDSFGEEAMNIFEAIDNLHQELFQEASKAISSFKQ